MIDLTRMTVAEFIGATAEKTPTPGGGSVAGVVGAMGTALGEMALAFTRGKKAFAEHEADYARFARRLTHARELFVQLVADDVAAYSLYQEATRSPEGEKADKTQIALAAAIDVPREMTAVSLAVLEDLVSLLNRCNSWLVSDLAAGAVLVEAVVRLCDFNVRTNSRDYADTRAADEIRQASQRDCQRARQLMETIESGARQQLSAKG